MKLLKFIVIVIMVLLVLIGVGVFALVNYFDPNKYKEEIIAQAAPYIGERTLAIDGDLSLTFYPWIGIQTGKISLSNPQGFAEADSVSLKSSVVRLKLLPLIQGHVEVDTVVLTEPHLNYHVLADGRTNFDGLGAAPNEASATDDELATPTIAETTATNDAASNEDVAQATGTATTDGRNEQNSNNTFFDINNLQINGVEIENGFVQYRDDASQQQIVIEPLTLELGEIVLGESVDLKLDSKISGSDLPKPITFALDTEVLVDQVESTVTLFETLADITFDEVTTQLSLGGLKLDQQQDVLSIPAITISQPGVRIQSNLSVQGVQNEPIIAGSVEVVVDDVQESLKRNKLDLSLDPHKLGELVLVSTLQFEKNKLQLAQTDASIVLNEVDTRVAIPQLNYDVESGALSLSEYRLNQDLFLIQGDLNSPSMTAESLNLKGNVSLKMEDLPGLLAQNHFTGILSTDGLESLAGSIGFSLQGENLSMKSIKVDASGMVIEGSASVKQFFQPKIVANLKINEVDVDVVQQWFVSKETNDTADNKTTTTSTYSATSQNASGTGQVVGDTATDTVLPTQVLDGLTLDVQASIGRVVAEGLEVSQLTLAAKGDANALSLEQFTGDIASGQFDAKGSYRVRNNTPAIKFTSDITAVDVDMLMAPFVEDNKISGKGNIKIDIAGSGTTVNKLIADSDGTVSMKFLDGAFKGIDLQAVLVNLLDALKGVTGEQEYTYQPEFETKFAELSADFNITDGVFKSDNVNMKAPALRVDGKAEVNIPRDKLNLRLGVNVVNTVEGQGGAALDDLKGIRIPFKIKGSMASPSFGLDFTALWQEIGKRELKEELKRQLPATGDERIDQIIDDPGQAIEDVVQEELDEQINEVNEKVNKEIQRGLEKLFKF